MIEAYNIKVNAKSKNIIDKLDFSCEQGELVVILGPNGAGKSTFLSVLADEMREQNNKVVFKTKEYTHWCPMDLPKHKAKFSQQYNSDIPLTVEEVIMMGRYPYFNQIPEEADKQCVCSILESTDLCKYQKREYNHLSGGEKQRVHLARVLVQLMNDNSEKVLFLDEPLNNLDIYHQHKVLHLIKEFTQKQNTAIVVLHDLNLAAQFADKILLLKQGKKVNYDTPELVLTNEILSGVYDFPCNVINNPLNNKPLIIFGN